MTNTQAEQVLVTENAGANVIALPSALARAAEAWGVPEDATPRIAKVIRRARRYQTRDAVEAVLLAGALLATIMALL